MGYWQVYPQVWYFLIILFDYLNDKENKNKDNNNVAHFV